MKSKFNSYADVLSRFPVNLIIKNEIDPQFSTSGNNNNSNPIPNQDQSTTENILKT